VSASSAAVRPRPSASAVVPFGLRTIVSLLVASTVGVLAFGWPLLADPGSAAVAHAKDAPWVFAALLPLVLAVVLAQVADGGLDAKGIALLGVMSAAAAALRPFGGGTGGFEPMWIVVILGGRALGPGFGFSVGSIGMFASALITGGVGPWLPFQMIAAAWVGLGAGLLPRRLTGRAEIAVLSAYAAVACVLYGFVLNLWFWPFLSTDSGLGPALSYVPGAPVAENLHHWLLFCAATSLGYDIPRAAMAVALVVGAGRAVLLALRRASRRGCVRCTGPVRRGPARPAGPRGAPGPAGGALMELVLLGTGAADGWPNPWCTCASCAWARRAGVLRTHTSVLLDRVLLLDCGPDVPRQADRAGTGLAAVQAVLLSHGHWDHTGAAALLMRSWAQRREPLQLLGPPSALELCRHWVGPDDPVLMVPLAAGDKTSVAGTAVVALAASHRGNDADPLAADALLYDLTSADGSRLLYATDTAALPPATMDAVAGAAYDVVLLDETFGTVTDHGSGHLDLASFASQVARLRENGAITTRTEVLAVHLGHRNPPGDRLERELAAAGARAVPDLTRLTVGDRAGSAVPTRRTLLLGGARSGKSGQAEARMRALRPAAPVTYVATSGQRPDDAEWAQRLAAHRARRPADWVTQETTDVAAVLRAAAPGAPVLVDCLSLWLAEALDAAGTWQHEPGTGGRERSLRQVAAAVADLVAAVRDTAAYVVLVSNEVGAGVVPEHDSGRVYRDLLGTLNADLAAVCDEVCLVVAGRCLPL
jgi:adenosylcobinamide kinase/adenosylcobinamide-phosphate guanylyltransferase